jgi:predicted transcriptional regulator
MSTKKSKIFIALLIVIFLGAFATVYISKQPASANRIVKISKSFKGVYKIRTIEFLGNTTKPEIKILMVKLALPEGLSEKEITKNLKAATVEIYNREKPYKIMISAYSENANIETGEIIAKSEFGQENFNAGTDTLNLKKYKFTSTITKK